MSERPRIQHPGLSKRIATRIRKLTQKKYRQEFGQCIIEGERIIRDALAHGIELDFCVAAHGKLERLSPLLGELRKQKIAFFVSTDKEFEEFSDTVETQGVFAIAKISPMNWEEALKVDNPSNIVVGVHELSDPGNLGTIIRTCDWFGVKTVLLTEGSVDPYNPKAVRASMGSIFRTAVAHAPSYDELLTSLKRRRYEIYAAESSGGESVYDVKPGKKVFLLLGSEAHGLPESVLESVHKRVHIPRLGDAESLNVAVANGILLSKLAR